MDLKEFFLNLRAEVNSQISDGTPYAELAFCEIVMQHLTDVGMTFDDPTVCHFQGKFGRSNLRLSGYSLSQDNDQLDLFVSLYSGEDELRLISDQETKKSVLQCFKFFELCANGRILDKLDPSTDVYSLAYSIRQCYFNLEQIRIYVLTDRVSKAKSFKSQEVSGKNIRLEVVDVERLFRHQSAGKPRDELVIRFDDVIGRPLPCVFVEGSQTCDYDYALSAFPAEILRFLYEKYGPRLLEANVRSFLSVRARGVNSGIQNTLRSAPDRFMAYNNGIVVIADDIQLERVADGGFGISVLRGMQIVNGGQTTASIFFTKRKFQDTNLDSVMVPTKIIIIKQQDPAKEESLIADISRFANSQNAVRQSDLSANKPFHIEIERHSLAVYCPDGVGRWFYERAAGSYNTFLSREGTTRAKLKKLKETIPTSRKITKTDLAKYLVAWNQRPDIVSLGAQKCFNFFMLELATFEDEGNPIKPDVQYYKSVVSKAILYKSVHKNVRPLVSAFLANVTAYTVSLMARYFGESLDFEWIWTRQSISPQLIEQVKIWAPEVNRWLHSTANGKMISEWAKRPECLQEFNASAFSDSRDDISEVRL